MCFRILVIVIVAFELLITSDQPWRILIITSFLVYNWKKFMSLLDICIHDVRTSSKIGKIAGLIRSCKFFKRLEPPIYRPLCLGSTSVRREVNRGRFLVVPTSDQGGERNSCLARIDPCFVLQDMHRTNHPTLPPWRHDRVV